VATGQPAVNVHAATLTIDLHVPQARSLKSKRAVVRPILEGLRHRFAVAAAEVDHQDQWQRAGLAVAVVGSSASQVVQVLDAAERFVWSNPEIEVLAVERRWLDGD
jgi:uncharacterized protein YlxP (DUF503 family)